MTEAWEMDGEQLLACLEEAVHDGQPHPDSSIELMQRQALGDPVVVPVADVEAERARLEEVAVFVWRHLAPLYDR